MSVKLLYMSQKIFPFYMLTALIADLRCLLVELGGSLCSAHWDLAFKTSAVAPQLGRMYYGHESLKFNSMNL